MTRSELLDRMTVLLGGRAAEMLVFNEATTGAADDLQRATEMARAMVSRYGMEAELGQASFVTDRPRYLDLQALGPQPSETSDETQAKIDAAISALVTRAFDRATEILRGPARPCIGSRRSGCWRRKPSSRRIWRRYRRSCASVS
jgi:cell division protease FtsH